MATGNLITNGGFESDVGSTSGGNTCVLPTGWQTWNSSGILVTSPVNTVSSVLQYGNGSGSASYIRTSDPVGPSPGSNYLYGGFNSSSSTVIQLIDLAKYSQSIRAGAATYSFSAWQGGFSTDNDTAAVVADFYNHTTGFISTATLAAVTATDRGNVTKLIQRTASATVPITANRVLIRITFTRSAGSTNDAGVDEVFFGLTGETEGWPVDNFMPDAPVGGAKFNTGIDTP